jgi:hypothetical protein
MDSYSFKALIWSPTEEERKLFDEAMEKGEIEVSVCGIKRVFVPKDCGIFDPNYPEPLMRIFGEPK